MPITVAQEFTFETDDLQRFEYLLSAACPVLFQRDREWAGIYVVRKEEADARPNDYPSETAALFLRGLRSFDPMSGKREDQKPLYWPVCEIVQRNFGGDRIGPFGSREELVRTAMGLVAAADPQRFTEVTARGPFERAEGGITIGYRMHWSSCRGEGLEICLCHVFYAK